jgi:hypothetical protein
VSHVPFALRTWLLHVRMNAGVVRHPVRCVRWPAQPCQLTKGSLGGLPAAETPAHHLLSMYSTHLDNAESF